MTKPAPSLANPPSRDLGAIVSGGSAGGSEALRRGCR